MTAKDWTDDDWASPCGRWEIDQENIRGEGPSTTLMGNPPPPKECPVATVFFVGGKRGRERARAAARRIEAWEATL